MIGSILNNLVSSSFIIERQPPQVIKTQTRFGAQLRLLIGTNTPTQCALFLFNFSGNKLSMHMNPPSVRAVIVSESQAQEIMEKLNSYQDGTNQIFDQTTGDILNSTSVMEFNPSSGVLSANFRNMSLRYVFKLVRVMIIMDND